jgi:hypothetical protein
MDIIPESTRSKCATPSMENARLCRGENNKRKYRDHSVIKYYIDICSTFTFLYYLSLFHIQCTLENTKKSYRCHYIVILTSPIFVVLK